MLDLFTRQRSSTGFITFVVAFATFTDFLLYGMIIPVVPAALRDRVSPPVENEQRWVSIILALYGAAQLLVSPIAGYAADRARSRQWPMIAGLVLLAVGTVLLCIGTHLALWITGRVLQGASTAVVFSVGCALLVDTAGDDYLGTAMGYLGMAMTLGALLGPLLGGVMYEHAGYYTVFGFSLGLIGIDLLLRLIMIERKDVAERGLTTMAPSDIVPTKSDEGHRPDPEPDTTEKPAPLIARTHSRGAMQSSLPSKTKKRAIFTLLSSPSLWAAMLGYLAMSIVMASLDTVIPLFVRDTFGWAQTAQGLIFLPQSIPHLLDPVIGCINDRHGRLRRYLAAIALLITVPTCVLLRLVSENSTGHEVLLCALLALLGLSTAILVPVLFTEVSRVVAHKEREMPGVFGRGGAMALAYGIWSSVFAAGLIAGPLLSGFVRDYAGWNTMSWTLGLVTGLPVIPLFLLLGGYVFKSEER